MAPDVFQFNDYKAYLNARLDDPARGGGRGARSRLSTAMGCQTAYTAQVLKGKANFSMEQAEAANDFLGHGEEEASYFLLLIQLARAGSPKLKARLSLQADRLKDARLQLRNRLGVGSVLGKEAQTTYYSAWYYAAIHALVSVPGFRSSTAISSHLGIEARRVQEALSFLAEVGILNEGESGYEIGTARIHLGADSPLISKHHTNWRLQAIRSLERANSEDLHYSSVISCSENDRAIIREALVKAIEEVKKTVRSSEREEVAQAFSVDFFGI